MWARSHTPEDRPVKGALRSVAGAVERLPLGSVGLDLLQKFAHGVNLVQSGRQTQQGRLEAAARARILAPTDAIQQAFDSHQRITHQDDGEVQEAPVLEVRVVRTENRKDSSGRTYCAFVLECRFQKHLWYVERRFSHFFALDQEMRRHMGWEHSRLLPAMPPRTLFGMSSGVINSQRRQQLNEYITSLCDLAANGQDVYRRDEEACEALAHVPKQLYSFVDFVHFVLPSAEQERRESESEEARANEPAPEENGDPADTRHPKLLRALSRLKKTKEKLTDERLKMESDSVMKHSLVQQLTEKQAKSSELREQIADGDERLEQLLMGPKAKIEEALRVVEAREVLHAGKGEALAKCGRGASVVAGLQAMQSSGLYGARIAMAQAQQLAPHPLRDPKWQQAEEAAYYMAMQLAEGGAGAESDGEGANDPDMVARARGGGQGGRWPLMDPDRGLGRGFNDPEPLGRAVGAREEGGGRGWPGLGPQGGGGRGGGGGIRGVAGEMLAENARVWRVVVRLAAQREKATRGLQEMALPSALHAWDPRDLLRFTCFKPQRALAPPRPGSASPEQAAAAMARPRSSSPAAADGGEMGAGSAGLWDWRVSYQRMVGKWSRGAGGGGREKQGAGEGTAGRRQEAVGMGMARIEDLAEGVGNLGRGLEEAVYLMASELEDALAEQARQAQAVREAQDTLERLERELCEAAEQRDDALAQEAAAKEGKRALVEQQRVLAAERESHNDPDISWAGTIDGVVRTRAYGTSQRSQR